MDYAELHRVCKIAHKNLDRIIDINEYPVPQARLSNLRHRPVGLGVQGFADALLLMGLPFEDTLNEADRITAINPEARRVNKLIAETMYHACLESSMELARDRAGPMKILKDYYRAGFFTYNEDGLDAIVDFPDIIPSGMLELLQRYRPIRAEFERDEFLGSYSSFIGSPTSKGLFQYDLWGVTPMPQEESHLDWAGLKAAVAQYGLRNSLTRANMPTASTSQILGNAESIEPYKYCIYTRRVLAGEFVVVNKHLHKELSAMGMWTEDIKAKLMANRGSVQNIEELPRKFRDKYKTAYEITKKVDEIFRKEHDPFVDQTTSRNAFISDPTDSILTKMHVGSWRAGLKTGMYYLRREPVAHAVRYDKRTGFSVENREKDKAADKSAEQAGVESSEKECTSCSA